MKISRKAPRPRPVPDMERPASELSEEEKIERLAYAMREAREYAKVKEQEKQSERAQRAIMEHRMRRSKMLEHAAVMEMCIANPGEDVFIETHIIGMPSPEVEVLMANEPTRFTGLQWDGLSPIERIRLLEELKEDVSKATVSSVLEALPDRTRDYLLRWQRQINEDEYANVWLCSQSVSDQALRLINDGFCLRPKTTIFSYMGKIEGRTDIPPGSPGTPAFVRAVMGEAYLVWLTQQEG